MKSLHWETISGTILGGPLALPLSTLLVESLEETLLDVQLMLLMGREIIVLVEGLGTDLGLKTIPS